MGLTSSMRTTRLTTRRAADLSLIGVGLLLRLVQYLDNRSLWIDEASLALNLIRRSYAGILQPLDYHQAAPPGFLLSSEAVTSILGTSEYAFRLLPLLFGIAALPLFYGVARRYVGPTAVTLSLVLFAFSPRLIWYSSEFKHYSLDLFVALVVLLWAARIADEGLTWGRAALIGAVGAICVWFSYPIVFVLAGVGVTLAWSFGRGAQWRRLGRLSAAAGAWSASFLAQYFLLIRDVDRGWLQDFWQDYFVPLPPTSVGDMYEWGRRFGLALQEPLGLELYYAGLVVLAVGSWVMLRRRPELLSLLLLPAAFTLLAAALKQYPFGGRLVLFLVPALALLVAEGMAAVWERSKGIAARGLALVVIGSLLWAPVVEALGVPFRHEELRPVVTYLEEHYRPGDVIYVYYGAEPAFRYYARRTALGDANVHYGVRSREDRERYLADLDRLRGKPRVWIVFSHVYGKEAESEERLFLSYLDRRGVRRDEFRRTGAALFLYDLEPSGVSRQDPARDDRVDPLGPAVAAAQDLPRHGSG